MNLVVIGAGEVGSSIAASLSNSHDVVVVDVDPARVESLTYSLDVLAIEGDGTSLDVLREAGVEEADILIASTDDDETNLVACATAATVSDAFAIARVRQTAYYDTWRRAPGAFDVDFMVCTDLLAAQAIVRIIGLPTARDVDPFAGEKVQMAEFEVPEGSPVANQTVQQADTFDALTFAALVRGDTIEIARGDTAIRGGDKVVVIGAPASVQAFAAAISPGEANGVEDVVVVGGSEVGFLASRLLEERGFTPRLIEHRPDRARDLAERLPRTTVLEHDATDLAFLEREHVGESDVVVAALDSDEKNLLVSLLARRLGADRTVALVDQGQYVPLFETVGVDVAVNPREVTAEEITRFTREDRAENVAIIESDRAEVLEIEIDAESVLANRPIADAVRDLPEGLVVGAVTRGDDLITPRGNTVVEPGDHVVVFVRTELIDQVAGLL